MKNSKKGILLSALFVLICAAVLPMACLADEAGETVSYFANSFWALVPPIIAIGLALITKEVYSSLFIGVVIGGLFSTNFRPVAAMDNILNGGFIAAVSDTAGIFIFLVVLFLHNIS